MSIHALTADGKDHELHPDVGPTIDEMMDRLTKNALTGSGAPLADVTLPTVDGLVIKYSEIRTFSETSDFLKAES